MAEIVSQQLQLNGAPQSSPRPAVDFVYKSMTQPRKKRLDWLSHPAHQPFLRSGSLPRQHKYFGLSFYSFARFISAIGLICRKDASVCRRRKPDARFSVSQVSRSQGCRNDPAFYVDQHVHLEAEEPSGAGLAEVRPLISKQPHDTMTNGLTDRDRLGVYGVKREAEPVTESGGLNHLSDNLAQPMKACDPLLVGAESRESLGEVKANEAVSLLERSDSESRLHQSDSQYLGISESRIGVRRRAPSGPARVGFEVIIDEAIDFSHLIYNGSQRVVLLVQSFSSKLFYTLDGPLFQLKTHVKDYSFENESALVYFLLIKADSFGVLDLSGTLSSSTMAQPRKRTSLSAAKMAGKSTLPRPSSTKR